MGNDHIGFAALMLHKGLHQPCCFEQASILLVGSSKNMRLALRKERASATRWRCPSDSCELLRAELCIQAVRQLTMRSSRQAMMRGLHDAVFRGIRSRDGDIVTEC